MKVEEYKAMIPTDYRWCKETLEQVGWEFLKPYIDRLTKTLCSMPRGSRLNILDPKTVSEQGRPLFVKMAWLLIVDCKFPISFIYTDAEFYLQRSSFK